MKGELYLSQAETDHHCPSQKAVDCISAANRSGAQASVDFWPNVKHGFMHSERFLYSVSRMSLPHPFPLRALLSEKLTRVDVVM
jgi:hypothetical protein